MKPGHNNPPSDFDTLAAEVEAIYGEAENWLDGEPAETEGQAESLEKLLGTLRDLEKKRAAAFKEEKQPWLDKCREIDSKWKPLKERLERAVKVCRAALTPYREAQDRARREAEQKAREEAERKRREAEAALRKQTSDIRAREDAERQLKEAKRAEASANKTARAATGLRTVREAHIVDLNAAVKHYWSTDREDFEALVQRLADRDIRQKRPAAPGIEIVERKIAT